MQLNEIIKKIRTDTGISQEDLAREIPVAFGFASKWEYSHVKPNIKTRYMIPEFCIRKKTNKELVDAFEKTK